MITFLVFGFVNQSTEIINELNKAYSTLTQKDIRVGKEIGESSMEIIQTTRIFARQTEGSTTGNVIT